MVCISNVGRVVMLKVLVRRSTNRLSCLDNAHITVSYYGNSEMS